MRRLSRFEFLKIAAVTGAGSAFLAACGGKAAGVLGGGSAAPPAAARDDAAAIPSPRAGRPAPGPGADGVVVAEGPSASANVERAVAALGGMSAFVSSGDVVVIKPNIVHARAPKYAVTTDPDVGRDAGPPGPGGGGRRCW